MRLIQCCTGLLCLVCVTTAAHAQISNLHAWWGISYDGATGEVLGAGMHFLVAEGASVSEDPARNYFVSVSGNPLIVLQPQPNRVWAYWSPPRSSEAEIIAEWPPSGTFAFYAKGVPVGSIGPFPGVGFSNQIPMLPVAGSLDGITPGERVVFQIPEWDTPHQTDESTWIGVTDAATGQAAWTQPPVAEGSEVVFDTSGLQQLHAYELQLTYSSRFLGTLESEFLGTTSTLGGFDRTTLYRFTTGRRCSGDVDLDGSVGFDDLNLVLGIWGQATGDVGYIDQVDLDGNGLIDFNDLNEVLLNWGVSCQ